jgi:hypothetical protein
MAEFLTGARRGCRTRTVAACSAVSLVGLAFPGCGLRSGSVEQNSSNLFDPVGQTVVVHRGSERIQICFDRFSEDPGQCQGVYRIADEQPVSFSGGTCVQSNFVETPKPDEELSIKCSIAASTAGEQTEEQTEERTDDDSGSQVEQGKSCFSEANLSSLVFSADLDAQDLGQGKWHSRVNPQTDYVEVVNARTCGAYFSEPQQSAGPDEGCQAPDSTSLSGYSLLGAASDGCFPENPLDHPTDLACIIRTMALEVYSGHRTSDASFTSLGQGKYLPDRCYVVDTESEGPEAMILSRGSTGKAESTGGFVNFKYILATGTLEAAPAFLKDLTPISVDLKAKDGQSSQGVGFITSAYLPMQGLWKTVVDNTFGDKALTLVYEAGLNVLRWVPKTYCARKYASVAYPGSSISIPKSPVSAGGKTETGGSVCR